jgi:hypothetical protein
MGFDYCEACDARHPPQDDPVHARPMAYQIDAVGGRTYWECLRLLNEAIARLIGRHAMVLRFHIACVAGGGRPIWVGHIHYWPGDASDR